MQENPSSRTPEKPPEAPSETGGGRPRSAVFFGFAATILVISGLLLWGSVLLRSQDPDPASAPPANNRPASSTVSDPAEESAAVFVQRLLGVWEGKLALFTEGRDNPDEVYDVYIQTLPEEEQERLRKGIVIQNEEELAGWLEDYTS